MSTSSRPGIARERAPWWRMRSVVRRSRLAQVARHDAREVSNGIAEPLIEPGPWCLAELVAGQADVGTALRGIVGRQRPVLEGGVGSGELENAPGDVRSEERRVGKEG